jgi:uncharacterized membrane protein YkoI
MQDRGRDHDDGPQPRTRRRRAVGRAAKRAAMRALVATVVTSLLLLGGAVSAATAPVVADSAPRQEASLTLDRAVEMVQRRYAARAVRAEETREGEEVIYRIRLLSADGHVFTVHVNARTGRVD